MKYKPLLLKSALAGLAALACSTAFSASIIFVSFHSDDNTPTANAAAAGFTQAPDVGYTQLLRANGHIVTRYTSRDIPEAAILNSAELVIISRSVPSGHYELDAETAAWNGITAPMMVLNGYLLRNSRLGYTAGTTMVDVNSNPMKLSVKDPTHPIFEGISLDAANLMVNDYAQRVTFNSVLQNGISINNNTLAGGGTLLATVGTPGDAALNGMVIGEWQAGATMGTSPADTLGGKRVVFLSGSRENTITSEGAGIYDLLTDGEKMFLNAVKYLTPPKPASVSLPLVGATNLFPGDAWTFNAGVRGSVPLTFQWYKNGSPMPTGTNATLTFTNLTSADAGEYYLIVTNLLAAATSTVASLEFAVLPSPNITNSIVSYWPLDAVEGSKTIDRVSGYDLTLVNMGDTNLTAGKYGNAFAFDNAAQTILERLPNPDEALPIYQHPNFSISMWVSGVAQTDHRVFGECNTTNGSTMFDLGTHNSGTDGTVDIYIRLNSGTEANPHRHSTGWAFDGVWHQLTYVQRDVGNGNIKAQLWVDGVLDPVNITPGRPLTPNTISIGGLRRASASAWFTGSIDEVAVWNRALTPQEVGVLQVTTITNPPSKILPLEINGFKADLPAIASGGSTVLRWDVSKDATQVTIDPIGDVTAQTSAGLGSIPVTLSAPTTYVLTIKRGAETLTASTSVTVVDGVAAGWALLDNFDQYPPGNLYANGYWSDTSGGSAQVLTINNNRAVRTATGNSIAYLNLRDLTLMENQARTLFFRVIAGPDNAAGATNIVGLTDKSQRNFGDSFVNIGPVVYATAFTNDLIAATTNAWYLGARNGYFGGNTSADPSYPGPALESGVVYNVWIDMTNAPVAESLTETFSVYVQKEGQPGRTLMFQDYVSDRDPTYIDAVLGGMRPNLDKLVILGNNANNSVTLDDFYLSTGGYNATVPRAYAYTGNPPGPVTIQAIGNQVEVRWTNGTLQQATSLTDQWTDVAGNPTSPYTITPAEGSAMFYRTRL